MNQTQQATQDIKQLENRLAAMGYENTNHPTEQYGEYANVLGMLWEVATDADNDADYLGYPPEVVKRAAQEWQEYNDWKAVIMELLEAQPVTTYEEANADRINEYEMRGERGRLRGIY